MSTDIHSYGEKIIGYCWEEVCVGAFDYRSYRVFGWLAGVRNYSAVGPIAAAMASQWGRVE